MAVTAETTLFIVLGTLLVGVLLLELLSDWLEESFPPVLTGRGVP